MTGAYPHVLDFGYSVFMVSAARRRRAWILLLIVWAGIGGVAIARYVEGKRDAAARLDREAAEQAALRAMNQMAPPSTPDASPSPPPEPAAQPGGSEPGDSAAPKSGATPSRPANKG